MLADILEAITTKLPEPAYFAYLLVTITVLLVVGVPLFNHMVDRGTCTTAITGAQDSRSFDAAYAQCVELGIVPRK
jgi:hypothetical protein